MTVLEIAKIRKKYKAKHGPWNDPVFYDEMAKKTRAQAFKIHTYVFRFGRSDPPG